MQRINIGFYNPRSLKVNNSKNKRGKKRAQEDNSYSTTSEVMPPQASDHTGHESKEENLKKRSLIMEIRGFPKKAQQNQASIVDSLSVYRLKIAGIKHKAIHIDHEIWSDYHAINREIPKIISQTKKFPLALCSKSRLQSLRSSWLSIIHQQENLLVNLAKAPNSVEFYNKMLIRQGFRAKERTVLLGNQQKMTDARRSIELALDRYITDLGRLDERIYLGSQILRFDNARQEVLDNLTWIQQLEKSNNYSTDEVLSYFFQLEQFLREAPSLTPRIREIENNYTNLISTHNTLVRIGKGIIPEEEISRTTVMLYEKIPEYWVRGNYVELERLLESLETFILFYDGIGQKELELAERKRPGFTRYISAAAQSPNGNLTSLLAFTHTLVDAIDSRDRKMPNHSTQVTDLSVQMAKVMNWNEDELKYLELAALLHDVGKLSIPENILSKTEPLSVDEWKLIQKHPSYGASILKPVDALNRIVPWIYYHQERWDGTGYPERMSKKDIPLASSIIGVAEAYTAMKVDLPSRNSLSDEEAITTIQNESERQFNPEVVKAFVEIMKSNSK